MKIYAAADIHARHSRLTLLRETLKRTAADVFIAAGDTFHYAPNHEVLHALDSLPVPVIAVRGNTDRGEAMRLMALAPNISCLHLASVSIDGIEFVGIGGTVPLPFRSLLAFREKSVTTLAAGLTGAETVLVAHPPPYGVRDLALNRFHVGSRRLRELVLNCRPRVLVCGHVHEQAGSDMLGETLVVNCSMGRGGSGALICLDPDRPPRVEML